MRYIQLFESFITGGMPEEITREQWKDLEIVKYDEYGGIVKNTPIPRSLFEEIVEIGGAERYLPTREHGSIWMQGRKPNTKNLYVLCFKKEDDDPFYLMRFTTDDTPSEQIQRERGYIKLYVADDFEQVKNFCKENL
jgi:hypothetical protein